MGVVVALGVTAVRTVPTPLSPVGVVPGSLAKQGLGAVVWAAGICEAAGLRHTAS